MKYYLPDLVPDDEPPPATSLEDQYGGLPWGLPAERWPLCASCGAPQPMLAQIRHAPGRLDLGKEGQVLFVFACAVWQGTKLGGAPFWVQIPEVPPGGRFVGQIDSDCYQAFGDNGIGYIFLGGPAPGRAEPTSGPGARAGVGAPRPRLSGVGAPRGWFLWQCT